MALTADEQELYDLARRALPWWYAPLDAVNEQLYAKAVIMGQALAIDKNWLETQAFILSADGPTSTTPDWLGEHAHDRATSRQASESNTSLRTRLRVVEESLHLQAILDAAQSALTAAGVIGSPAILELLKDKARSLVDIAQTGTGGTFAIVGGSKRFTPTAGWYGGRPPFQPAILNPDVTYKLVVSGAASAGNNGTFTITGVDTDGALFINGAGVAGADATVVWRVDRYWHDGSFLTEASGRHDAYFNRGYRMAGPTPTIVVILPFSTTEATRLAVVEAIRVKKAAGVLAVVERRAVP